MAYHHLCNSPSWLPTLHLGYNRKSATASESSKEIFSRLQERKSNSTTTIMPVPQENEKRKIVSDDGIGRYSSIGGSEASIENAVLNDINGFTATDGAIDEEAASLAVPTSCDEVAVQTELTSELLQQVINDSRARVVEACKQKKVSIYDRACYVEDESKVPFYTGLPTLGVLDLLYNHIHPSMSNHTVKLSKEQEFLMSIIKLKMNYQFQDIAYQLDVSESTVQRGFHRTLKVLVVRLSFLIRWPGREELGLSMPMCFRKLFHKKVVVIVDCFEMPVEKPPGAANQVQTYSNYKHNQTAKYLICVTPQGSISFISSAWGGRASDKHIIIEKSGLLTNLLPGDVIMADRGFGIQDEVMFYQAKLAIPNFTHGKKQLHPLEVENTRKIASLRIHVERIIGLVRRKFAILQSTVPIEFMKVRKNDRNPTLDKIVKVCCCLINLHASVVPSD